MRIGHVFTPTWLECLKTDSNLKLSNPPPIQNITYIDLTKNQENLTMSYVEISTIELQLKFQNKFVMGRIKWQIGGCEI